MHCLTVRRGSATSRILVGLFVAGVAGLSMSVSGANAFGQSSAIAPEAIRLWPNGAPGAVGDEDRDRPDVRVFLPAAEKATGAAVVICPGGGYVALAYDHEGQQVARFLNTIGVAGVVLKYRLAPRYRHPAPLDDAQRAIRFVRAHADEYKLDPQRVGILGFSAGGHLASTAATHFDDGQPDAADPLDRLSSRPNFAVLCYPVITLTESFGHTGSKKNLLGDNPDPKLVELLSNEKQVTARTPPTFLWHTGEDSGVPVENSLAFYAALRRAKVPGELHVYQIGPHGIGLAPADPAAGGWKDRLADWLRANSFLSTAPRAAVKGKITVKGAPLKRGMIAFASEDVRRPVGWAMVANGTFSVPAEHGATIGPNLVTVYDLGSVEPLPTITDSRKLLSQLPVDVPRTPFEFTFDVTGE